MKILKLVLLFIPAVLAVGAVLLLFRFVQLGKECQAMTPDLGLVDGHLRGCPSSPNCVSTTATDAQHAIEKITLEKPFSEIRERLLMILTNEMEGRTKKSDEQYFHLEFHSRLFGFIDDFEIYAPEKDAKILEVRSASRVGKSDLGVNRKRVEKFRELITK